MANWIKPNATALRQMAVDYERRAENNAVLAPVWLNMAQQCRQRATVEDRCMVARLDTAHRLAYWNAVEQR